jgi:phosphoribosylamine-glycine ligase
MHVKRYEDVSKHVTDVNEKLSKFFKKIQYRGFFSTEIIVSNNKKDYLIDPCMRLGNPPAAITEAAISNLAEVVANGAVGILVNPIYKSKYAVQLSIYNTEANNNNLMVKVPDSISEYVKLNFAFKAKDIYNTLANGSASQGYVVGLGDTLEDAKKHCIDNAKKISGNGIEFNFGAFEKLDKAIEKGKTVGIDF